MRTGILFVSRKGKGKGGMQQLSTDLWQMICRLYPNNARAVVSTGVLSHILLLPKVLWFARTTQHVHLADAALSPLAWILSKIYPHLQISVTACGLDLTYDRRLYQAILRHTINAYDVIVCISNHTAKEAMSRVSDPTKVVMIPCGIWKVDDLSTAGTGPVRLITVGRLIRRKGVAWFIESVLPLLLIKNPDLIYTVVGDGPDVRLVQGIVKRLELESSVELLSNVSEKEKNDLYRKSHLFVMPNIPVQGDTEGFGIVCIEASARGIPVVAARIQGVQDAVRKGKTGTFFETEDALSAAKAIQNIIEDPFDRNEVARYTRAKYSWDVLQEQYARHVFNLSHRHSDVGLRRSQRGSRETAAVAS